MALVSLLWGTTWMASKIAVESVPSFQVSGLRHLIGGSCYVLYFMVFKKMLPKKQQLWRLTWMSFLMFVLSNGLSVLSIVYIPSGLGAVVGAVSPIWMVILSFVVFKHAQFKPKTILGILLGFTGVVVTFYDHMGEIMHGDFSLGIIAGVVSSITWAAGTLLTVKQSKDMDPYFSLGWQMFLSGIMLNIFSHATGQSVSVHLITSDAWLSIAYLVIIGSVIAFGAYIYALNRLPATLVSIHSYINPIVAVILGFLLMNEKLTLYIIIGTIITLIGVYLVNLSFRSVPSTAD